MPETLAALLAAHMLADFLLQNHWMVAHKPRPVALAAHGGVVLATACACLGQISLPLVLLALLHIGIDLVKAGAGHKGLLPFVLEQAAHLASLVALATLSPDLWAQGIWASLPQMPALLTLSGGALACTRAGGYLIALFMTRWVADAGEGLPQGGQTIGYLERGLIFLFILTGNPDGIGFLIAAKSILRFGTVKDDRKVSEYVIIGTLASFGWAIVTASATKSLLAALPPLGILPAAP